MEEMGDKKAKANDKYFEIVLGLDKIEKSLTKLGDLVDEINGEGVIKADFKEAEFPIPCLRDVINTAPSRLNSMAENIENKIAQIREILF